MNWRLTGRWGWLIWRKKSTDISISTKSGFVSCGTAHFSIYCITHFKNAGKIFTALLQYRNSRSRLNFIVCNVQLCTVCNNVCHWAHWKPIQTFRKIKAIQSVRTLKTRIQKIYINFNLDDYEHCYGSHAYLRLNISITYSWFTQYKKINNNECGSICELTFHISYFQWIKVYIRRKKPLIKKKCWSIWTRNWMQGRLL